MTTGSNNQPSTKLHNEATGTTGPDSQASTRGAQPGDLARRVAHRRAELGLSFEELARRAGVDPGYLRYFERSPDARVSAGTLLLLALALETTPIVLQGGNVNRPPGSGRPGPHPILEALTHEQCHAPLSAGGIGRVVYATVRGPVAVPVNFQLDNGAIVISTNLNKAVMLEANAVVGFEVDRVDEAMSEGWSVLVTGVAHRVDDPDECVRLAALGLEPWAGGNCHVLMKITLREMTGRVIVHHPHPEDD